MADNLQKIESLVHVRGNESDNGTEAHKNDAVESILPKEQGSIPEASAKEIDLAKERENKLENGIVLTGNQLTNIDNIPQEQLEEILFAAEIEDTDGNKSYEFIYDSKVANHTQIEQAIGSLQKQAEETGDIIRSTAEDLSLQEALERANKAYLTDKTMDAFEHQTAVANITTQMKHGDRKIIIKEAPKQTDPQAVDIIYNSAAEASIHFMKQHKIKNTV